MTDLLPVLLPDGNGWLLVYSLYCDETYCRETDHVIVAGYLIGSGRLQELTNRWQNVLGGYGLEYFHMRDGHHISHPKCYQELAQLISYDHVTAAFCASVLRREYESVCSTKIQGQALKYWIGGEYSFCVGAIAQLANQWLNANNPSEKYMAYVFDAGNEREKEADMFFKMIASDPLLIQRKRMIRYYSHSFVDGKRPDGGALQAADMLAWNLGYRQREKKWEQVGAGIIDAVNVHSVFYGKDGLLQTLLQQGRSCEEYGALKHALVLNPRKVKSVP